VSSIEYDRKSAPHLLQFLTVRALVLDISHQDDANWPLQEGAVLKKRFDDIFDSTRYTKALDVFTKLKKEYNAKVKDIKVDVAGFASHLHAAKGFQQEIEKYNDQLEEVEEQISDNKKSLKETQEEQERLNEIVDQITEIQADISDRKTELGSKQELKKETREMLEEDLTSEKSARELKEMLRDFDSKLTDQVEEKEDLESEISRLQKDISDLTKQDSSLQSKLWRYQAEKDYQVKRQEARFEKMVQIGNSFGLDSTLTAVSQTQNQSQNTSYHASSLLDSSLTAGSQLSNHPVQIEISKEDMNDFFRALTKKETELKDDLSQKTRQRQRNEDQMQAQLAEVMGKLVSIEKDRAKLKKESEDSQKELKEISSKGLGMSRLRKDDVEEAKRNAAKFATERDKATSDPERTQIPIEIRSYEVKIDGTFFYRDLCSTFSSV
jgi:DNA repair protein RAD50